MQVVAIGDGNNGGGGETRVAVRRQWVGVVKDGGGGGCDAQIEHRQKPMPDLGIMW